jgi:hypothetical protein
MLILLGLDDEDGKSFCWSSEARGERETWMHTVVSFGIWNPMFWLSIYAVMTDCY